MNLKHFEELKRACSHSTGAGFAVEPACYDLLALCTPVFEALADFRKKKQTYGVKLVIQKLEKTAEKLPSTVDELRQYELIRLRSLRTKRHDKLTTVNVV